MSEHPNTEVGTSPVAESADAAAARRPLIDIGWVLAGRLDDEDRLEMLQSIGLEEPALHTVAQGIYRLLGLQSYYTAGEKEVRAWTIPTGATAPQAAGVIHTDFQRGFIRAEVFSVDDLVELTSEKAIRDKGRLRVEGKEYTMRDGDVVHFLFNV